MSVPFAKSYQGFDLGMNMSVPWHEIPDGYARFIQDGIMTEPGILRRRGPVQVMTGIGTHAKYNAGIAVTADPTGHLYAAVLSGTDANGAIIQFYDLETPGSPTAYSMHTTQNKLDFAPNGGPPTRWFMDAKSALGGGVWISIFPRIDKKGGLSGGSSANGTMALWRGAVMAAPITTTTTSAVVVTPGVSTKTVSVADTTGISPGMFISGNAGMMGMVMATSTASGAGDITLEEYSANPCNNGATVTLVPMRSAAFRNGAGRITTVTTSAVVNGTQGVGGTKFKDTTFFSGGGGQPKLYRASDKMYIGYVDAANITNDSMLTLNANAGVSMTDEEYFMQYTPSPIWTSTTSGSIAAQPMGQLNATWGGRQWFANNPSSYTTDVSKMSRVWFSKTSDGEAMDFSQDGSWFQVASSQNNNSPITAIIGIQAGLMVFKENESFMVTGTDEDNFAVKKVADVGCMDLNTVQGYGNGVIFGSVNGIFYYDGARLQSLTQNAFGSFWRDMFASYTPSNYRGGSFVYKNYYVMSVNSGGITLPKGYAMKYGASSSSLVPLAFCINMDNGAVTMLTNVNITGSARYAGSLTTPGGTIFTTFRASTQTGGTLGWLIDPQYLFTGTGNDTFYTYGGTVTTRTRPDFYLETKKYDLGDPERKKLFKQFTMNYKLVGDTLSMDVSPGALNETGVATTTPWAIKADWTNTRKKFTKRSTHVALRFYEGATSAVTEFQVGPHQIVYKVQRIGRV